MKFRVCPSLERLWTCWVTSSQVETSSVCMWRGSQGRLSYVGNVVTIFTKCNEFGPCQWKSLLKSYWGRSWFLHLNMARGGFPHKNIVSPLLFPQLVSFLPHCKHVSKQFSWVFWNEQKNQRTQFTPLLCLCVSKSNKWYKSRVLIVRLTPWEILKIWMLHKESYKVNLWPDLHISMHSTTTGGKTE